MNVRTFFSLAGVSLSLALVACAAPTGTDGSDEAAAGSDEALVGGHNKVNTTVAATCGSAAILNGFPVKSEMWSAEITESVPAILNGFPIPTFSVVVKKGDTVQATLENCTGNLANWSLHCTSSKEGLGVSTTFDLSDKSAGKGVYQHSVVSPGADVESHPFFCTPPKSE